MRLVGTSYSLKDKALDIFLSGCKGNCKGCHNEELKDFSKGELIDLSYIKRKIDNPLIEKVRVMGGEPLDQDLGELEELLKVLQDKEVWVFTRYTEIPIGVWSLVDYLKCGEYREDLGPWETMGITLASSNQYVMRGGK